MIGLDVLNEYKDNYFIYLAEIVEQMTKQDSRLRVRVLPTMKDIEIEMLPKWPCFFKEQMLGGLAKGSKVWVFALPDFTAGWILGEANPYSYGEDTYSNSINELFNTFKVKISLHGFGNITAENLRIFFWNKDLIDIWEPNLKLKATLSSDGTIIGFNKDRLVVSFQNKSAITMTEEEILFKAKKIRFLADKVVLAEESPIVTMDAKFPVVINGVTFNPHRGVKA